MSHLPEAAPGLPPGRYGEPRRLPRWAAVLLVVVGVVALIPVARGLIDRSTPDARAVITGFTIESDSRVSAVVDVSKRSDQIATCALRARDQYSDAVGSVQLVLDDDRTDAVLTRSFPTSDRAVTVEVLGCTTTPRP